MTEFALPDDLFVADNPAKAWMTLQEQSADARSKRTDLIGVISLEERAAGAHGWRERVQNRLANEDQAPVSDKVISDASKIFDLFRLGGDQGLGWTREQVGAASHRQLRVFAQNAAWSLGHRAEVQTMLESDMTEEHIRKAIQESKLTESGGQVEEKEVWETVTLRLNPVQARFTRKILEAVRTKGAHWGEEYSDKQAVADGEAVYRALTDWYFSAEEQLDQFQQPFVIENKSFVDADIQAEIDAANEESEDGLETEEGESHSAA